MPWDGAGLCVDPTNGTAPLHGYRQRHILGLGGLIWLFPMNLRSRSVLLEQSLPSRFLLLFNSDVERSIFAPAGRELTRNPFLCIRLVLHFNSGNQRNTV